MRTICISFLMLLFIMPAFSQEKAEAALQLTHKSRSKQKYVKIDRKLTIHIADAKYKGRIDSIAPDKIYIGGNAIAVNEIENIRFRMKGTQIAGGIVGTFGLLVMGLGVYAIIDASNSTGFGAAFAMIIGVMATAVGTIPTTLGTVFVLVGKSHKNNKWEFETLEIIR